MDDKELKEFGKLVEPLFLRLCALHYKMMTSRELSASDIKHIGYLKELSESYNATVEVDKLLTIQVEKVIDTSEEIIEISTVTTRPDMIDLEEQTNVKWNKYRDEFEYPEDSAFWGSYG